MKKRTESNYITTNLDTDGEENHSGAKPVSEAITYYAYVWLAGPRDPE